jgi:hypothetical protein
MKTHPTPIAVALTAAGLLASLTPIGAQDKPQFTVKEVMQALHKGDDALSKKVSKGEGTPADFNKLVLYYTALPLNTAPKGDATSWKEKSTALLVAAQALETGKPGALDQYKAAVNCNACHSVHKPD